MATEPKYTVYTCICTTYSGSTINVVERRKKKLNLRCLREREIPGIGRDEGYYRDDSTHKNCTSVYNRVQKKKESHVTLVNTFTVA